MPLLPLIPILTTAGRFTLPYLQRELVKQGTKKFLKDHGKEALTAVTGGVILNRVMDDDIDPSITQSVGVGPEGLVIGGEPKETLPQPPPLICLPCTSSGATCHTHHLKQSLPRKLL